ncbi:glycosyltransferase family 39 protein [Microbispora amethystogenes]|uniref:glycosyltransferase family 39 protein n=1 Tax=Microbispora amethystogenes TaxID=1427754 RepID=UPI0033CE6B7D
MSERTSGRGAAPDASSPTPPRSARARVGRARMLLVMAGAAAGRVRTFLGRADVSAGGVDAFRARADARVGRVRTFLVRAGAAAGRVGRPSVVTAVPAVLALAAGLWDLGGPPLWRDEAATVSAAVRTLPQTAHLLSSVDAVHGLYYALMHVVVGVFGTAEVALRLPSVLAGALAAAGTGALGRALGLPRAGLYGGTLLALMPIFSRYVQEARPYAMTTAAAVGVTLLLVRVLRSPTPAALAGYAVALTALAYLNLFAFLVAGAHGVVVVLSRGPLARWACATAASSAAVAPLAWLGSGQGAQVSWIRRPEAADAGRLAVQMFGDLGATTPPRWPGLAPPGPLGVAALTALGVAPLAWVLALLGLALGLVSGIRAARAARAASPACRAKVGAGERGDPFKAGWRGAGGYTALVRVTVPWLLVPATVLLAASWAAHPVYVFRYVLCCVPAAALLAGAGLAALPTGVAVAALAAWIGLSVPGQLATRGPDGRQDDPRPVLALLASASRPGDGVMFVPAKVRKYVTVYPSIFGRLSDVALARSPEWDGSFGGREVGPRVLAARLAELRTLWVVGHTGKAGLTGRRLDVVTRSFVPAGRWTSRGMYAERYEARGDPRANAAGSRGAGGGTGRIGQAER